MSWEYIMTGIDTAPTHTILKFIGVKKIKPVIKTKCCEYNDIEGVRKLTRRT